MLIIMQVLSRVRYFPSLIIQLSSTALKIERSASPGEVKRAYRRISKIWHPDKNPNEKNRAEKEMMRINSAYEVLSDPVQRESYDNEIELAEVALRPIRAWPSSDLSICRPRVRDATATLQTRILQKTHGRKRRSIISTRSALLMRNLLTLHSFENCHPARVVNPSLEWIPNPLWWRMKGSGSISNP